jgi:hypothetical protein
MHWIDLSIESLRGEKKTTKKKFRTDQREISVDHKKLSNVVYSNVERREIEENNKISTCSVSGTTFTCAKVAQQHIFRVRKNCDHSISSLKIEFLFHFIFIFRSWYFSWCVLSSLSYYVLCVLLFYYIHISDVDFWDDFIF